ncbi:MAG: glutamyl-tRNA reductase [Canidatus Methanoxibalbensis ujae]|nr:glutamyl-tRNA reductase [Candidatus Methanoxibalbensis ujae]
MKKWEGDEVMPDIGVLSFSYRRCTVDDLTDIFMRFRPEMLSEDKRVSGFVFINTCNRVEIYVSAEDVSDVLEDLRRYLGEGDIICGVDAINHLFRVSCGLESMIVGEDQILGQIRKSYFDCKKAKTIDEILDIVFDRAVKVGKRVRRETRINEGSVSIGSAAVELAERETGGLKGKSILVIGAGEMGTLVAKALAEKELSGMFIANRTFEKAIQLAREVGGFAARLEEKEYYLRVCDVVISTTSAPHYILTYDSVKEVMAERRNRELLIIDIANPRDVEERVSDIEGVKLFDIDCLREISEENLRRRLGEVSKVERIIEEELRILEKILKRKRVERLISSIYNHGRAVGEAEINEALAYLRRGKDAESVLNAFSRSLMFKTLHPLVSALKKLAENEAENETADKIINFLTSEIEKETQRVRREKAMSPMQ